MLCTVAELIKLLAMAVQENDLKLVYIYTATEQSSKLLEILEASFMKG